MLRGKAGWAVGAASSSNDSGGVYSLVVWPSSSLHTESTVAQGAVAAQIYMQEGRVLLSASTGQNGSTLYAVDTKDDFTLVFSGSSVDEKVV
jgi:hypothetical protein